MKFRIVTFKHYGQVYFQVQRRSWFGWRDFGSARLEFERAESDIERIKSDAGYPIQVVWSD